MHFKSASFKPVTVNGSSRYALNRGPLFSPTVDTDLCLTATGLVMYQNLKFSMFTMFTMLLSRLTTHLSISELVFCTVQISGHKQQSLNTAFSHTDHPPTHKIKCCSQPFVLYLKTSFKDLKFLKFAVFSTL